MSETAAPVPTAEAPAAAPPDAGAPGAAPAPGATYGDVADTLARIRTHIATPGFNGEGIITLLQEATAAQKTLLKTDQPFWDTLSGAAQITADDMMRVGQALFLDPKWLIWYYAVKKPGSDLNVVKRFIGMGTMQQRMEIAGWEEVCRKVKDMAPLEHPGNVFGEDADQAITAGNQLGQAWANYPWYMDWRSNSFHIDVEGHWQFIGQSAANVTTSLAPLGTTGTTMWDHCMRWSPRGAALSPAAIAALDNIGTQWSTVPPLDKLQQAFMTRFNVDLVAASAMGETAFTVTANTIQMLWDQCRHLPMNAVNQQMVQRIAVYTTSNTTAGYYNDLEMGNPAGGVALAGNVSPQTFAHTIRHEIGHGVDVQVNGYETFTSVTGPAQWRRYRGYTGPFMDDLIAHVANGDAALKTAALAYLGGGPVAAFDAAVDSADTRGVLFDSARKQDIKDTFARMLGSGGAVQPAKYDMNGAKFFHIYADYQMYQTVGEEKTDISTYAFNATYEYFAEIYAKWFDGNVDPTTNQMVYDKGAHLPGWVATSNFPTLVEGKDPQTMNGGAVPAASATGTPAPPGAAGGGGGGGGGGGTP
jgi:hypothetical protein